MDGISKAGFIALLVLGFALLITVLGLSAATVAKLNGGATGGSSSSAASSSASLSGGPPGSQTDSHGCKPSAGYVWCPALGKCVRPWETACPSSAPPQSLAAVGGPTQISGAAATPGASDPAGPTLHPNLTATEAQSWIQAPSPSTIVVWRAGCSHCDSLKSKLAALSASGALAGRKVGLLTASEAKKLGTKLDIHGVPALLKVGAGAIRAKHEGDLSPADILRFV